MTSTNSTGSDPEDFVPAEPDPQANQMANRLADQSLGAPPRPEVIQLSRRWLTASLLAVTLIPVSLAATVWLAIPTSPEPRLPVEVFFEPVAWPPDGQEASLMPGVRLYNPTDEAWTNVSLAINKRFYFYSPEPLNARGEYRVPLSFFRTSGNQPYRPALVPMQLLTVYAQLPSGRRAILDVHFEESEAGTEVAQERP